MKTISNILIIFITSLFLLSCSDTLKGFKLKKKSTSGDEFLIQKKDPLVLPPDFSKLPKPKNDVERNKLDERETIDLNNVFSEKELSENEDIKSESSQDSDLKESILKKIK